MKIEEAFARYLGQEVLVYTVSQGGSLSSVIDCTLEEIGDGWVRVTPVSYTHLTLPTTPYV